MFAVLILLTLNSFQAATLKQVIVISRHGIRGPQNKIDNLNCTLHNLNAQIGHVGHMQNFKLGQKLRDLYGDLIGEQYQPKLHYFYGTDEDKNLMSGNTVAQGIFSSYFQAFKVFTENPGPNDPSVFPSIPVHVAPGYSLTSETAAVCKNAIDKSLMSINTSAKWMDQNKKFQPCYAKIKGCLELPEDTKIAFYGIPKFAEQIILTTGHLNYLSSFRAGSTGDGSTYFTTGDLGDCLYKDTCSCTLDGTSISLNDFVIYAATLRNQKLSAWEHRESAKLRNTPFIHYALEEMRQYIAKPAEGKTFIFHLASNTNVQGLLQLFNQITPGRVPFGSIISFELYETGNPQSEDGYGMKIIYRTMDTKTFKFDDNKELKDTANPIAPGDSDSPQGWKDLTKDACGADYCTLKQLEDMVYTMDEWQSRCEIPDLQKEKETLTSDLESMTDKKNVYQALFIAFTALLAIALVVCIVIIALMCCCGICVKSSSSRSSSQEMEPTA